MLKLDLLRLCQSESSCDIRERFLRKNDRTGTDRPDLADELNILDCCGEELQTAAVLFKEA